MDNELTITAPIRPMVIERLSEQIPQTTSFDAGAL